MDEILYVDWDGLIYYDGKIKDYVSDSINGCLKFEGDISPNEFDEVPPSRDNIHTAYKVNDKFTTNEWFKVPGKTYPANSIIYVAEVANEVYLYDILFDASIPDVEVDLSNYYTKSDVDALVEGLPSKESVSAISKDVANLSDTVSTIIDDYVTHAELDDAIADIVIPETPDLSDYVTSDSLDKTLESYATLQQVDEKIRDAELSGGDIDISDLVTKDELNAAIENIDFPDPDLSAYATIDYVDDEISKISIPEIPEVDLTNYYTKDEVDDLIPNTDSFITMDDIDKENFATESWVKEQGYLTTHQSLDGKADKNHTHTLADITDYSPTDLSDYATTEYVDKALEEFTLPEEALSNYYNKSEVDSKIAEVASGGTVDLSNYYTIDQTDDLIAESVEGLATEDFVSNEIAKLVIPTKTSELINDSDFVTSEVLDSKSDVGHSHPEYLTENALSGYATTDYVDEAVESIVIPEVDLSDYATKDFVGEEIAKINIPDVSDFCTESDVNDIIDGKDLVTNEELNNKKFLTEDKASSTYVAASKYESDKSAILTSIGNLNSDKADKSELNNYLKQSDADKYIDGSELTLELMKYATKGEVSEVSSAVANKVESSTFESYKELTANTLNGITTDIANLKSADTAVNNKITNLTENKADKSEITDLIAQIDNKLEGKVDDSELLDYYTSSQVDGLISSIELQIQNITKLDLVILDYVPEEVSSVVIKEGVIYLIPVDLEVDDVVYDEYLLVNGKPEKLGSTNIDTSKYATKEDLLSYVTEDALNSKGYLTAIPSIYVDEDELANELAKYLTADIAKETYATTTSVQQLSESLTNYLLAETASTTYVLKSDYTTAMASIVTELNNVKSNFDNYVSRETFDTTLAGYVTTTVADELRSAISTKADKSYVDSTFATLSDLSALSTTVTNLSTQTTNSIASVRADLTSGLNVKANLADVYNKTEVDGMLLGKVSLSDLQKDYFNKQQVNDLIGGISTLSITVVSSISQMTRTDVIYLLPIYKTEDGMTFISYYDEYLVIRDSYGNLVPERIGDTYIDLSNYATKEALDNLANELSAHINNYVAFVNSCNSSLSQLNTNYTALSNTVNQLSTDIGDLSDELALKATQEEVSDIDSRVTTNTNSINEMSTTVTGLSEKVSTVNTFVGEDNNTYSFRFAIEDGKPTILYEIVDDKI